ncbi:SLBB domain-containing protein, partial [Flexistipes sinusarabici]
MFVCIIYTVLFSIFLNNALYSADLQNIPPEILQQARENPEILKELQSQGSSSASSGTQDKNATLRSSQPANTTRVPEESPAQLEYKRFQNIQRGDIERQQSPLERKGIEYGNPFRKRPTSEINKSNYVLGEGDRVKVEYTRISDSSKVSEFSFIVNQDGSVIFPYLGETNVNGLTVMELSSMINNAAAQSNLRATVDVIATAKINVGVFGYVNVPNFYSVPKQYNLFDIIAMAGGPINFDNVDTINIYEDGALIESYRLSDLQSPDVSFIELQGGETIYVQRKLIKTETSRELEEISFDNMPLFGASIFSGTTESFPDQNVTVGDDYIVGPADTLQVYLWGRISDTISMTVQSDGSVFSERFGKVQVAGKTFAEVKSIFKGLISGMEGVEGDVSLSKLRTIRVMVLGEVNNPGFHTLSSLSTIVSAITKAGGVNSKPNLRHILLKRDDKVIKDIDFYDLALYGKSFNDIYLQPNDVIFVPQSEKQVFVAGEVGREAIFEIKSGETLSDVLKMAGGLNPTAYGAKIKVKRFVGNQNTKIIDVSLKDTDNFKLEDGDKISVIPITTPEENVVYLKGNVYFPGAYSLDNNTTLKSIIGSKDNLKPNTAISYGYIKRYYGIGKNTEIISFSLKDVFDNNSDAPDIKLKAGDEIYILNRDDIMPERVVDISGEVVNPGIYPVADKLTLNDVIKKAGGLTQNADTKNIEIVRKVESDFITRFVNVEKTESFNIESHDKIIIHSVFESEPKKYIRIDGEVKKPGKYLLTKNLTIDKLIQKAGGLTKDAYLYIASLQRLNKENFRYKLITIDLRRILAGQNDFYLQDSDQLYIYDWKQFHPDKTVKITGEVNKPGEYTYSEEMGLKDLIILAGNVRDNAYLTKAEVIRMNIVNGEVKHKIFDVNLNEIMKGKSSFEIKPYDIVKVRNIDSFNEARVVNVEGEVKFPGEYVIRDNEKLYDVIMRAGGVTQNAFMEGLVFKRESVRKIQKENLLRLRDRLQSSLASVSSQEIASSLDKADIVAQKSLQSNLQRIINRLGNVEPEGRIVVDIDSVKDLKESKYNV